jgi:hypothetical protein
MDAWNPNREIQKYTSIVSTKSISRSNSSNPTSFSNSFTINNRTQFDKYQYLKQKIQNKGWLRKLMDYLTSHRSSISEAALHNFRLMAQTKGDQFKITGLIVVDYIINTILR